MSAVAIVPARAGSKRLPHKNTLMFRGKPMLAWTIEAALASGRFTKIIVSTDDEEAAAVASQYWVSVDKRPEHLATDEARVVDVCVDILKRHSYAIAACLYATAPLRTAKDIQETMTLLSHTGPSFALAATDYAMSPHQALKLVGEPIWSYNLNIAMSPGRIASADAEPMWPDLIEKRHDEMPKFVVDNGSTYCCFVEPFMQQRTFYGKPLAVHVMPRERSVDIDTKADLDYALWLAGR